MGECSIYRGGEEGLRRVKVNGGGGGGDGANDWKGGEERGLMGPNVCASDYYYI